MAMLPPPPPPATLCQKSWRVNGSGGEVAVCLRPLRHMGRCACRRPGIDGIHLVVKILHNHHTLRISRWGEHQWKYVTDDYDAYKV